MKNWILTHKVLSIILACVICIGAASAIILPIALKKPENGHTCQAAAEWTVGENSHYHACTHRGCDKNLDEAAHVYDKEIAEANHLKSAATYEAAAVYYKSCICGKTVKKRSVTAIRLPHKKARLLLKTV